MATYGAQRTLIFLHQVANWLLAIDGILVEARNDDVVVHDALHKHALLVWTEMPLAKVLLGHVPHVSLSYGLVSQLTILITIFTRCSIDWIDRVCVHLELGARSHISGDAL